MENAGKNMHRLFRGAFLFAVRFINDLVAFIPNLLAYPPNCRTPDWSLEGPKIYVERIPSRWFTWDAGVGTI
jgi:hypothetical protein